MTISVPTNRVLKHHLFDYSIYILSDYSEEQKLVFFRYFTLNIFNFCCRQNFETKYFAISSDFFLLWPIRRGQPANQQQQQIPCPDV